MPPASYSRWCPTQEQLMILEELYNSGVRTPNASQIQRITTYLSLYGKIQGKSVFYWFQNHKAREKKKLRNKLIKQFQLHHQQKKQVQCTNDDEHSHPLSLPASSALPFHRLSYHNYSPSFPHQGGVLEGAHTTQMMDPTLNVEIPPRFTENTNKLMRPMCEHNYNWMTVMAEDVGSNHPCCTINTSTSTRPLKTLELFPLTSTNLKEECNSTSPKLAPILSKSHQHSHQQI